MDMFLEMKDKCVIISVLLFFGCSGKQVDNRSDDLFPFWIRERGRYWNMVGKAIFSGKPIWISRR